MSSELLTRAMANTVTPYGASRRYDAMKCPRSASLTARGIRLKETPPYFEVGRLVHSALAYVSLGILNGLELNFGDVLDVAERDGRPFADEVRRIMVDYFIKWGAANAGYGDAIILDVEKRLSCVIDGDVPHTGRADAIISIGQHTVIVDHKTAASMPSASDDQLARMWRTAPQFLGLVTAYRAETGELASVMVNRIVKTKTPQFRRVFVTFTHTELDNWAKEHARMVRWLEQAQGCANYSACHPEGGRKCSYFELCHGTEEEKAAMYVQLEGEET